MTSPGRHRDGALQAKPATPASLGMHAADEAVAVSLNAAILAVRATEPVVAIVSAERASEEYLPCGPFRPRLHGTLEDGLRSWVQAQTGVETSFLQQLCALTERAEAGARTLIAQNTVSVSYLALVGPGQCNDRTRASWRSWYAYVPWEDWRNGKPECLSGIESRLEAWAEQPGPVCTARWVPDRRQRIRIAFGGAGVAWDEEKALERYELLCEAGIIGSATDDTSPATGMTRPLPKLMHPMLGDQTAVLARAIGELRRAIKCRPVVFELMHEEFTLFELQKTVEAILGPHLHKQNFRRLVEGCGLVEPTGAFRLRTGGRPARLYRFRPAVLYERLVPGVNLKPRHM